MYPKVVASKVTISPNTPVTHKICKNCKYFRSGLMDIQFGRCLKFGEQNLVDGSITYNYASITRKYECKGDYFEQQDPPFLQKMFCINATEDKEE